MKTTKNRCRGRLRNGPDKRYARCCKCGRIDWEGNEGDRCPHMDDRSSMSKEGGQS